MMGIEWPSVCIGCKWTPWRARLHPSTAKDCSLPTKAFIGLHASTCRELAATDGRRSSRVIRTPRPLFRSSAAPGRVQRMRLCLRRPGARQAFAIQPFGRRLAQTVRFCVHVVRCGITGCCASLQLLVCSPLQMAMLVLWRAVMRAVVKSAACVVSGV